MHPAIAEDRMAPHAEARGGAPRNGGHQPAALFADTRGFVEFAIGAPAHQLHARLFAPVEPGIEQLPRLPFAGGGAAMRDDEIERVARAYIAVEIHILTERLEIGLNCTRRGTSGAGRAIKAVAHRTANTQRGIVDADDLLGQ